MVEKRISIYGELDVLSPFNSDQLFFEISESHATLIVKSGSSADINAFEFFEFNKATQDWYEIFYQMRLHSKILDRTYNDTKIFYHLREAIVTPAAQYTTESAETYLPALFGDVELSIIRHDEVFAPADVYISYKIPKPLFDMVNTNLMMVTAKHSYCKILENILQSNKSTDSYFLKVIFYHNMLTAVLMHYGKLQLIQSYHFETADDMLYYLLNIVHQFNITAADLSIEVSGMLDIKSKKMEYVAKLFPKLTFDNNLSGASFKAFVKEYPAHYFTAFYNNLL